MTLALACFAVLWLACSAYVMATMWRTDRIFGAIAALLGPVTIVGALVMSIRCDRKGPNGALHMTDIE